MKYIILPIIYAYVLFMAWSAFAWMGVAYVVLVPIPFIFFSYLVRARQKAGNTAARQPMSIWSTPIPYFSIIFIVLILSNLLT